jgi:hypothetical protein
MNTAGTSGTHDTEKFNRGNSAGDAAAGTMKETGKIDTTETPVTNEGTNLPKSAARPEGEKETVVIEVLTQEPGSQTRSTDFTYFAAEEVETSSGFRWWYVPVIVTPVVVAAGTTFATLLLIQRRRRQELRAAELAAAAAATRNWLDTLRMRRALTQASGLVQQGVNWSRDTVASVPVQITTWRDQVPIQVGTWRGLVTDQANRLRKITISSAQPYVDAARTQALATRTNAYQAVNNAGDRISGTASHTLAFGLGALVSAVGTYVLRWRQKMVDADSEYTTDTNQMHEEPIL